MGSVLLLNLSEGGLQPTSVVLCNQHIRNFRPPGAGRIIGEVYRSGIGPGIQDWVPGLAGCSRKSAVFSGFVQQPRPVV
jgi:hypothetical protein